MSFRLQTTRDRARELALLGALLISSSIFAAAGKPNVLFFAVVKIIRATASMKALLISLALIWVAPLHAATAKPDVLVILTDQWSLRYLSWENPQVRTPHLDRIAGEGMIFHACYITSPVCMPAHLSHHGFVSAQCRALIKGSEPLMRNDLEKKGRGKKKAVE